MGGLFLPPQASSLAGKFDSLLLVEVVIAAIVSAIIAGFIVFFSVHYREGSPADRSREELPVRAMEIAWITVPLVIVMGFFAYGARLFFEQRQAPANAIEVSVVAKRWMWKLQHPTGKREINELHIPRGRPVKLLMTSEDVIHSFFVPAFRVKQDVLPGRYTTAWFEATRVGVYRLFCAEYCGTDHAGMTGRIIVIEPEEYERWLAGAATEETGRLVGGRGLFEKHGCSSCHGPMPLQRAPSLAGLYGSRVKLSDGRAVVAGDDYLRKSILEPAADVAAGYRPIMPSFRGRLTEAELSALVDYIKTGAR